MALLLTVPAALRIQSEGVRSVHVEYRLVVVPFDITSISSCETRDLPETRDDLHNALGISFCPLYA